MTPSIARLTRQAAQQVRAALARGTTDGDLEATRIITALKTSPHTSGYQIKGLSKPISPRLPLHVRVHVFIRQRGTNDARHALHNLMESGVRVRGKTIQAVFSRVLAEAEVTRSITPIYPVAHHPLPKSDPRVLMDLRTAQALQILNDCRRLYHPRSPSMFLDLIAMLLRQHEMVLATQVFEVMVTDFRLRLRLAETLEALGTKSLGEEVSYAELTAMKRRYRHLSSERLTPSIGTLNLICNSMQRRFWALRCIGSPLGAPMQSLVILATLLDRGDISFAEISILLKFMCLSIRMQPTMVWVDDGSEQRFIQGTTYLNELLKSVIGDLPIRERAQKNDSVDDPFTRPLAVESYNELLRYTIKYHPVELAQKVIQHMLTVEVINAETHGILTESSKTEDVASPTQRVQLFRLLNRNSPTTTPRPRVVTQATMNKAPEGVVQSASNNEVLTEILTSENANR